MIRNVDSGRWQVAGILALGVGFGLGCQGSSGNSGSKSKPNDPRLATRLDVSSAHRALREYLGECNEIVANSYRRSGKGNTRITFTLSLSIEAKNGLGRLKVNSLDGPADVPDEARKCIVERFPKEFASKQDFRGELSYETCLFVLPAPLARKSESA